MISGSLFFYQNWLTFLLALWLSFLLTKAVKSIFFIRLYVFLFAYDVLNINLIVLIIESKDFIYLDNFLKNTWLGELLSAIILAGFKILFAHWLKKEND